MKNKNKLLTQIAHNFPEIHWKSARYITTGFDNDVIILDNKTIFRFPKNSYSKKIVKDEMALVKFLAKYITTSLPDYKYIAKTFGGYPMIKGTGLTNEKFRKLSCSQQYKLAAQLGKFLTELHAISVRSVKKFHPRERSAEKELKLLSKDAKKYLYPVFTTKEIKTFDDFFLELADIFKHEPKKVLVHGDFSGDHFIVNSKNSLEGIIDFTDKAIHDPAFDFIFLWGFGQSFVKAVYANYKGKEKTGFLERSIAYAKASAVWNMVQAKKKGRLNFNQWYKNFKSLQSSHTNSEINIQLATLKDEEVIIKLHSSLYADDKTKTLAEIKKEVGVALKDKLVWVAKLNKDIIGYVLCELFDKKHRYFPNSIFIDGLYLKEEYRKKGVGRRLVEMIFTNKFPKQYTYFSITHDPAFVHLTDFYKSLGFVETGKTDAGNIMMIKKLK